MMSAMANATTAKPSNPIARFVLNEVNVDDLGG